MNVLNTVDAMTYLGVSRVTLMSWVKTGKVRARKAAGQWWFRVDDLTRVLPEDIREARKHG